VVYSARSIERDQRTSKDGKRNHMPRARILGSRNYEDDKSVYGENRANGMSQSRGWLVALASLVVVWLLDEEIIRIDEIVQVAFHPAIVREPDPYDNSWILYAVAYNIQEFELEV